MSLLSSTILQLQTASFEALVEPVLLAYQRWLVVGQELSVALHSSSEARQRNKTVQPPANTHCHHNTVGSILIAIVLGNARAHMAFFNARDRNAQGVQYVQVFQTTYVISVLYPLASCIPKLSLCTLYLRVFDISPWGRRVTYGTIAFLVINAIAWLVPTVIVCRPISAYWSIHGNRGKCLDADIFGTWISLPNIVTDLVMLVLPIPILWRTQMNVPKKLGLILTFATGMSTASASSLRRPRTSQMLSRRRVLPVGLFPYCL